jgi:hypothetical protein
MSTFKGIVKKRTKKPNPKGPPELKMLEAVIGKK